MNARHPADRTRLAWTRTAIAFAALGAVMLKWSPLAGSVVLALSLPVRAAVLVVVVVVVALVALVIALLGPGPASPGDLLPGR